MINLLPKDVQQRYHLSSRVYGLVLVYVVVLVLLGLGAAGLATYNYQQQLDINQKQSQINALATQKKQQSSATTKAAFIEDRLKTVTTYTDSVHWENLLSEIASATPTDIQITALHVGATAGKATGIDITGSTTDRRSIVLYSQKLATLSDITAPSIQNINETKGSNGSKSFTFTINTGVKDVH